MGSLLTHKKKEVLETSYDSLFDIYASDIDGNEHRIGDLVEECKLIMIVNVASK